MVTATEISLESQKDVQFLKSNISLATREKLDTHLPPSAVPNIHDDILRKRVEEMLDEVTTQETELPLISVCITDI
jgi:kinetochor protein Mis14/NSL1